MLNIVGVSTFFFIVNLSVATLVGAPDLQVFMDKDYACREYKRLNQDGQESLIYVSYQTDEGLAYELFNDCEASAHIYRDTPVIGGEGYDHSRYE